MRLTAPTASGGFQTATWEALGTTVVLRVCGADLGAARVAVQRELDRIDAAASRFRSDSELSRLNAAGGARMAVSPLFLDAVRVAIDAAAISGGAVDPTLGQSLVQAGYDCDWRALTPVPTDFDSATAARSVVVRRRREPWRAIECWDDPPAVRLPPGVRLDLGATAKALAADRAATAAHRAAEAGVLVALGGDIATSGPGPEGGWRVHVTDDHRDGYEAPGQTISILAGGLATSSVTVRRWLHRGRAMHHLLDPRDGEPVQPAWRTVSVAAATCLDANIASTAAVVLGPFARAWLAQHALPARLVAADGTVQAHGRWPK
jgi:thiamine biosynthesis lipoprotein